MTGLHIAIFNVAAPVHINPTLSVVAVLIRRGHRVTYITSKAFEGLISASGARVVLWSDLRNNDKYNQGPTETYASIVRDALACFDAALATFEGDAPDLILYDALSLTGLVVAGKLNVPAVRISPQLIFDDYNAARLPPSNVAQQSVVAIQKRYAGPFFEELGIQSPADIYNRDTPSIYFYVRNLQLHGEIPEKCSLYAGRCAAERPYSGTWRSAAAPGTFTVLVSTSTVYRQGQRAEYYKKCLDALSGLDCHAVLSIGPNVERGAVGPLPRNAEIAPDIPQLQIMPHADTIVCLGGMTTTIEAMYHGLSMIMLTHSAPEPELYAENVQQHGLGVHLRGADVPADVIRDGVLQVMSQDSIKSNVREMQRVVRRSAGAEEVCNWLEEYVG